MTTSARAEGRVAAEQAREEAPVVGTTRVYEVTVGGEKRRLGEAEYAAEAALAAKRIRLALDRIDADRASGLQEQIYYEEKVRGLVGRISEVAGQAPLPDRRIWDLPRQPLDRARALLAEGRLDLAARLVPVAAEAVRSAQLDWSAYIEAVAGESGGAQRAIDVLEFTRDTSFAIAIGTAAVLLAPIVLPAATAAAGTALGAVGVTSAGLATAAGVVGTGAVVTAGGAFAGGVLRGGTSVAGQAIAGGGVSTTAAWGDAKAGAKRGAIDAAAGVVTGGAGRVLGVGAKGLGVVKNVVRTGAAGGAGGAVGGGAEAVLEGKSAGEIATSTLKGGGTGIVGGAFGGVANRLTGGAMKPAGRLAIEMLAGGGGSATGVALAGGDEAAVKKAFVGGALGSLGSGAGPGKGKRLRTTPEIGERPPPAAPETFEPNMRNLGPEPEAALELARPGDSEPRRTPSADVADPNLRDLGPEPEVPLELGRPSDSESRRTPSAEDLDPSLRDVGPEPDAPLELARPNAGEPRRTTSADVADPNLRDLGPGLEGPTLKTERTRSGPRKTGRTPALEPSPRAPERPPPGSRLPKLLKRGEKLPSAQKGSRARRRAFGKPSGEKGGTEARAGENYRLLNAAEVAIGLRVDYDPAAGRPRKVAWDVPGDLAQFDAATKRGFAGDPVTPGAQPTNAAFKGAKVRGKRLEKGHLAQRQAGKGDRDVERALDHFTNVVPMTKTLNRGKGSRWYQAEQDAVRMAAELGYIRVEVEPVYSAKPPRLKGVPVPKSFVRRVFGPDGVQIGKDETFQNY